MKKKTHSRSLQKVFVFHVFRRFTFGKTKKREAAATENMVYYLSGLSGLRRLQATAGGGRRNIGHDLALLLLSTHFHIQCPHSRDCPQIRAACLFIGSFL